MKIAYLNVIEGKVSPPVYQFRGLTFMAEAFSACEQRLSLMAAVTVPYSQKVSKITEIYYRFLHLLSYFFSLSPSGAGSIQIQSTEKKQQRNYSHKDGQEASQENSLYAFN